MLHSLRLFYHSKDRREFAELAQDVHVMVQSMQVRQMLRVASHVLCDFELQEIVQSMPVRAGTLL